ncbi:MAG: AAA family ATPase [Nanoarchaeota archaeon]
MIIGVTGPICAGSDSFCKILEKNGFKFLSYSDILREEARMRGIELTRKNLQDLGDQMRNKEGLGVLSRKIMERISVDDSDYVVGNIRNPGEVHELRKRKDFVLVMVDAPFETRFQRVSDRDRESDPRTFDEFKKVEERDLGVNQKNYGQQHGAVFEMADFVIINDSSLEDFERNVQKLLEDVKC